MGHGLHMSIGMDEDGDLREGDGLPGLEEDDFVSRKDTGIRILLTLLFAVVAGVVRTVIGALVIFELGFALVTERPPSERVRELANRIVAYYYRLARYLTYNESRPPFPFDDFPEPVEPGAWSQDAESNPLGERDGA